MANWQRTLRLKDVYHSGKPPAEIAAVVAERLKKLPLLSVASGLIEKRDGLVAEFESMAGDPATNADDFDEVMAELYDWADTSLDGQWNGKKLCWVETF